MKIVKETAILHESSILGKRRTNKTIQLLKEYLYVDFCFIGTSKYANDIGNHL